MADDDKPTPSIRDRIVEAWDEVEPAQEVDTSLPSRPQRRPPPEEPERDELAEGIERRPEDQPRDDRGRFVPREEEQEAPEPKPRPEARETREPQERPEEPEAPEAQKEPDSRDQRLNRMTAKWSSEDKEFLGRQSPEVQDFLLDRTAEVDKAFTRKTQSLSAFVNEYGPVHQMLEPDLPAIQAAGYTPRLLIEGWANCERALLSGPQQAAATLRAIAEGYRVPREVIAHAFGFDPRTPDQIGQPAPAGGMPSSLPPSGAGNGHDVQFRDPRVDMMLAERQEQAERAQIAYNQQLRQAANTAMAQINQFREARDKAGNLLHPYFAEVEDYMTVLAEHHGKTTGKIPPLKELYDSAVNANTATRAKLLTATQAAQSERHRATEAARGKTEQARRAASSVIGSGRPANRTPAAPQKGQSIRASIDAAFQEVMGDQD